MVRVHLFGFKRQGVRLWSCFPDHTAPCGSSCWKFLLRFQSLLAMNANKDNPLMRNWLRKRLLIKVVISATFLNIWKNFNSQLWRLLSCWSSGFWEFSKETEGQKEIQSSPAGGMLLRPSWWMTGMSEETPTPLFTLIICPAGFSCLWWLTKQTAHHPHGASCCLSLTSHLTQVVGSGWSERPRFGLSRHVSHEEIWHDLKQQKMGGGGVQ